MDGVRLGVNQIEILIPQADEIFGIKTSDVVFARSYGTWTEGTLIGQYAYSCASGEYYRGDPPYSYWDGPYPAYQIGVWRRILANTATTMTVDGPLHETGTSLFISPWNPIDEIIPIDVTGWPEFVANGWFWSGCKDDGENIWFAAAGAPCFVKFDPRTKTIVQYPHGYAGADAVFLGLVNAGGYLWGVPGNSPDILRITPSTGEMLAFPHNQPSMTPESPSQFGRFDAGCYDGQGKIWFVPWDCPYIISFDIETHDIAQYSIMWLQAGCFMACAFANGHLWTPANTSILKLDVTNGEMTAIPNPHYAMETDGYPNGIYQGSYVDENDNVWFSPFIGPLLKLDTHSETLAAYPITGIARNNQKWPGQFGGVRQIGRNLYLIPNNHNILARFNLDSENMYYYCMGLPWPCADSPHSFGYEWWCDGFEYDGSIYTVPSYGNSIVKITPLPEM
jgi:hypothetical protein